MSLKERFHKHHMAAPDVRGKVSHLLKGGLEHWDAPRNGPRVGHVWPRPPKPPARQGTPPTAPGQVNKIGKDQNCATEEGCNDCSSPSLCCGIHKRVVSAGGGCLTRLSHIYIECNVADHRAGEREAIAPAATRRDGDRRARSIGAVAHTLWCRGAH